MVIRKDSWHYKLYEWSFSIRQCPPAQTNLCAYFWRVLGGSLFLAMMFGVCGFILGGVGVMLYKFPAETLGVLGIVALIIGLLSLISVCRESEPGLIRSYIRAKKDKVCPIVTFTSAEK